MYMNFRFVPLVRHDRERFSSSKGILSEQPLLPSGRKDVRVVRTCLTATGERLVATSSTDRIIRLWRISEAGDHMELVHVLRGHLEDINDMAIAPGAAVEEPFVVSAGKDMLRVWDVESGKHLKALDAVHDAEIQLEGQEVEVEVENGDGDLEGVEIGDELKHGFIGVEVVPFRVPLRGPFCTRLKREERVEAMIVCLSKQQMMVRVYAYPWYVVTCFPSNAMAKNHISMPYSYKLLFQKSIQNLDIGRSSSVLKCAMFPGLDEPRMNVWVCGAVELVCWDLRSPGEMRLITPLDQSVGMQRIQDMELSVMGNGEGRKQVLVVCPFSLQDRFSVLDACSGDVLRYISFQRLETGMDKLKVHAMLVALQGVAGRSEDNASTAMTLTDMSPMLKLAVEERFMFAVDQGKEPNRFEIVIPVDNIGLVALEFATNVSTTTNSATTTPTITEVEADD